MRIRASDVPNCFLCGEKGEEQYVDLNDRLHGSEGLWRLVECANANCRLGWLNPMPRLEDIGLAYQSYYTHTSGHEESPGNPIKKIYRRARAGYLSAEYGYRAEPVDRLLAPLIKLVPGAREHADFSVVYQEAPTGDARFLELGFGRGDLLSRMRGLGWETEGLDVDQVAVDKARARGLNVARGDVFSQAYPENSWDVIVLSHVLEHIHNPDQLLSECNRILKPAGRLVIAVPNGESAGRRKFGRHWLHLDAPRHLFLFNTSNLSRLVTDAGLGIARIFTSPRGAASTFRASRDIRESGVFVSTKKPSFASKAGMTLFFLYEWLTLKFRPEAGEELVVIATKAGLS